MQIHPVVQHLNGQVMVTLQPSFVGDADDVTDKARILAYGDPKVNLGGTFVDPLDNTFTFALGTPELYKGITTEISNFTAKFMTQLPVGTPGQPAPQQGVLDCITSDPVHAATSYSTVMSTRILDSLTILRAKTPPQLSSLPDSTV
jgi:hypothetical protein